jgi:precorrin-6A/cobalt-precorrin-6A reductase
VRVLILGGTGEARALAAALHGRSELDVVSSLAGRVSNPALPVGGVRVGGFGGTDGLVAYLRDSETAAVLDATHPFAARISHHAFAAARIAGVALLGLRRPGWSAGAGDRWTRVPDIRAAATAVALRPPGVVLLTTGRRDLSAFALDDRHHYVVRTVEPAEPPMPPKMTAILDRGPYPLDRETALMIEHEVALLVTKDSGGDMTAAKLAAARTRDIEVIMVSRPPAPAEMTFVDTVDEAANWVSALRDRN